MADSCRRGIAAIPERQAAGGDSSAVRRPRLDLARRFGECFPDFAGLDPLPEKSLLDRLDALALESEDSAGLLVAPHFLGERHAPSERGCITGITLQNFTLPHLARALATGIVHSLGGSFPPELYQSRKRVVGSGNCVRFCRSIQREIELQFQLPLEIRSIREEAAVGAAKLAVQSASRD